MSNFTEIEYLILATYMQNPDLIAETVLKPEHITEGKHRNLFKTFTDMHGKGIPIDPVTIEKRLNGNRKAIDAIGGITYLAEMSVEFVQERRLEYYCGLLLEEFKEQQAAQLGLLITQGQLSVDDAMERFRDLQEIGIKDAQYSLKDQIVRMFNRIESATFGISGIASGFKDLDKMLQGFHEEDFIIVAARPSVGKTAYALNVAQNAALSVDNPDGAGVAIFSLEMPAENLIQRMVGAKQNLDLHVLRQGAPAMDDSDWRKLSVGMAEVAASEITIIDEPVMDLKFIYKMARQTKADFDRRHPNKQFMIIIDYLQLIMGDRKSGGNRMQEISDISRGLKQLARILKCPVIALSQLSRKVEERQDKRPMMSDLRESGQIEQDADVIQFLYREDYYDKETEDQNMIEIIIAKQREGSTGNVKLAFLKEFGKFLNVSWDAKSTVVSRSADDSDKKEYL